MENKEITISRNWFERLIELAKKVSNDRDSSDLNFLMGYISSAEDILEIKDK